MSETVRQTLGETPARFAARVGLKPGAVLYGYATDLESAVDRIRITYIGDEIVLGRGLDRIDREHAFDFGCRDWEIIDHG